MGLSSITNDKWKKKCIREPMGRTKAEADDIEKDFFL